MRLFQRHKGEPVVGIHHVRSTRLQFDFCRDDGPFEHDRYVLVGKSIDGEAGTHSLDGFLPAEHCAPCIERRLYMP